MKKIIIALIAMISSATMTLAETITTTAQTQKEEAERIINRFIGGG